MTTAAIEAAIRADMAEAGVPATEFDPSFAVRMIRAMMAAEYATYCSPSAPASPKGPTPLSLLLLEMNDD